jgi:hypothetical protein
MISRRCILLSLGLFTVVAPACATEFPPGVTCEGLHTLRIGMSSEEVRRIVGPPLNTVPWASVAYLYPDLVAQSGSTYHADVWWDYGRAPVSWYEVGGRNVHIEFSGDRVARVTASEKSAWHFEETHFWITKDGITEDRDFTKRFCW